MIDRRTFVAGTGAVLLAVPLTVEAQQARKVYRIGVLANEPSPMWEAFRQRLKELGYVEGQNMTLLIVTVFSYILTKCPSWR